MHPLSQSPGEAGQPPPLERVYVHVEPHDWRRLPSPFRVYPKASFRPIVRRRGCWCTFDF